MAIPLPGAIDALCIAHMEWPERPVQCGNGRPHHDQVYVVRHEAIRQHRDRVLVRVVFEPSQIRHAVGVTEEYCAPAIASLCDVMREPGTDDARNARHLPTLTA